MDQAAHEGSIASDSDVADSVAAMTTTLDQRTSHSLPPGISTDDDESLGSSIPEVIDLKVILPDGTEKVMQVNSSKQMLDLSVQLCAANRLSPANHTLALYHPDNGRPMDFKASQMVGALGVDTVHVVNKKANKERSKRHTAATTTANSGQTTQQQQPFEMTFRLQVNLPRGQRTILRISPTMPLSDVYKSVCADKALDPYKHELRHPTQPDIALNMASPVGAYNVSEITVVSLTASDQPTPTPKPSIYDSHWTYNSTMPRGGAPRDPGPSGSVGDRRSAPPTSGGSQGSSYMPGMGAEKKKKKGFLGLFSRKKEGKFNLADTTVTVTSNPPASYEPPPPATTTTTTTTAPQIISNGNKPQAEVKPRPKIPPQPENPALEKPLEKPGLEKPRKTKRKAPAPPPTKPLTVTTDTVGSNHSRGSSHSSGFDETSVSPLESPGGGSKASDVPPGGPGVSRTSSLSTGGSGSTTGSLARGKKKRKAPPPPPVTQDGSTPTPAPPCGSDEHLDVRELQIAIAEELKQGRPELRAVGANSQNTRVYGSHNTGYYGTNDTGYCGTVEFSDDDSDNYDEDFEDEEGEEVSEAL